MGRGLGEIQRFILDHFDRTAEITQGEVLWAWVDRAPQDHLEHEEWRGVQIRRIKASTYNSFNRTMRNLSKDRGSRLVGEERKFSWDDVLRLYPLQTTRQDIRDTRARYLRLLPIAKDKIAEGALPRFRQEAHMYSNRFGRLAGQPFPKGKSEDLVSFENEWPRLRQEILHSLADTWQTALYAYLAQCEHYFRSSASVFARYKYAAQPADPQISLLDCIQVLNDREYAHVSLLSTLKTFADRLFPPSTAAYVEFKATILYPLVDGLGNSRGESPVRLNVDVAEQLVQRDWQYAQHLPGQRWSPAIPPKKPFGMQPLIDVSEFSPLLIHMIDRDILKGAKRFSLRPSYPSASM